MGFSLSVDELQSRAIREIFSENGEKIIEDILTADNRFTIGNALKTLWNVGKGLLTISPVTALLRYAGGFTGLFGFTWGQAIKIYNFDFNASDQQLLSRLRSQRLAAIEAWGEAIGQTAGTILAAYLGYKVALAIPVIGGQILAKMVANRAAQERLDEIIDSVKDALRLTGTHFLDGFSTRSYILFRRITRFYAGSLTNILPGGIFEALSNWGVDDAEPFILAEQVEEAVDSIPWDELRVFTEGLLDGAGEAFVEAGFIIANFLDDEWRKSQITADGVLGGARDASIELDSESDEQIRVANMPSNLAIANVSNLIATHRLIHSKDIGNFTEPDDGRKVLQPYLRTCKITLRDVEKPPFIDPETNNAAGRHQITLKSLKPNLRWRDFKRALRNHRWGPWKIEATLESRVTMILYAAEKEAGKTFMKGLISDLCEEDYIRVSATEEELDPRITKLAKFVYPEKALVTLKRERPDGTRKDLAGKRYEQETIEFRLWTEDAPFGTPEFVTNFSTPLPT